MTAREQLMQAIQTLPESEINRVLAYINKVTADSKPTQPLSPEPETDFDERWWQNLSQFTPDFLDSREQPKLQEREDIFL